MDGMECIREDEEEEQHQKMDSEAGIGNYGGGERNAQEELAKMASALNAVQSQTHGEEEDDEEESSKEAMKPRVKKARKLLFRRLRVCVEDGRTFIGKFHCLDKQGNIILYDTKEFRPSSLATPPSAASKSSRAGEAYLDRKFFTSYQ